MLHSGLYLVTPDWPDSDALVAAVAALLPSRPALVQYRNKLADDALKREQALRLLAVCRAADVPLIVNDDLALALEIGADGAHLGRDDGDPAAARRALQGLPVENAAALVNPGCLAAIRDHPGLRAAPDEASADDPSLPLQLPARRS